MARNLVYCTYIYPGDAYSEKVFADSELNSLTGYFENIVLLPTDRASRKLGFDRSLPPGVSVDWRLVEDKTSHSRFLKILRYSFHPFVLESVGFILREAKSPQQFIKGYLQALNTVSMARVIGDVVKNHGFHRKDTVLYSLWFHDAASAMAYFAKSNDWQMATRAHTSDIYDEQMLFRSRKVRNRLLDHIQAVFPISIKGRDYLAARFPDHASKIKYLPLGSQRVFTPAMRKGSDADEVTVVAVARLVPVKRLDKLIDVFSMVAELVPDKQINLQIIGSGECENLLQNRIMEKKGINNFHVELAGRVYNEDIQRMYSENPPDWFSLMSYSEGIPVSVGEAMSYGIPVISTEVGSVGELVDDECGILLGRDDTVVECAEKIVPVISDAVRCRAMGRAALKKWEKEFDSEKSSMELSRILSNLLSK